MKDTKKVDLLVTAGVILLLCIMGQEVVANEIEVVNRASTISENENILSYFNQTTDSFNQITDSFVQARNIQCNKNKTRELLTKSKREKIMVSDMD